MATFFERFLRALRIRLTNSLEESLDPQEQLAVLVEELDEQVADLRQAVAIPLAQEKRLKLEIEGHLAKAGDWESRAILALEGGDEELARQALVKKEELESSALELQKEWENQRATARKLQDSLRATKKRVDEAKRKYSTLVARHQSAVAQKKIVDMTAAGQESPMQLMDRLQEKIHLIEAEAATDLELSGESLGDDLESKFVELERHQRGDQALAELKARVAERKKLGEGPKQLAEPQRPNGASRVAELKAKLDESR